MSSDYLIAGTGCLSWPDFNLRALNVLIFKSEKELTMLLSSLYSEAHSNMIALMHTCSCIPVQASGRSRRTNDKVKKSGPRFETTPGGLIKHI